MKIVAEIPALSGQLIVVLAHFDEEENYPEGERENEPIFAYGKHDDRCLACWFDGEKCDWSEDGYSCTGDDIPAYGVVVEQILTEYYRDFGLTPNPELNLAPYSNNL